MTPPLVLPGNPPLDDKPSWKSLVVFVLALCSLVSTMVYSWGVLRHMTTLTEDFIQPALGLRFEAALTHLWTEEMITGDSEHSPGSIDKRYAQLNDSVDRVAAALQDPRVLLWLTDEAGLKRTLDRIKAMNSGSREIAARRMAAPEKSQPGSASDEEQDAAFAILRGELANFNSTINRSFAAHYRMVIQILLAMISFTLLLGMWVGVILVRHRARRLLDMRLLQEQNLNLQAMNQQLTATEQQLRASNQQLTATEQQLRASNQQLTATEQQLRFSNATLQSNNRDLEEKERRYRNLIDTMAEGVAIHHLELNSDNYPADYRILEVNGQFAASLELSRDDVTGRLASEVFGGGSPPWLAEFAKVALGGVPKRFDTMFAPLKRYFSISVSSFEPGFCVTLFTDITERKQSEAAIRLNEERLESLLEITQHSASAPQQLYREALTKALELTGSSEGIIYLVDPENGLLGVEARVSREETPGSADSSSALQRSMEGGEFHQTVRVGRAAVVKELPVGDGNGGKDGSDPGMQVMGIPLFVNTAVAAVVVLAGKNVSYLDADLRQATLLMDAVLRIAELRRADDEKHRLSVRMQKLESLGVLAGGIAHDFNNMLAGILGNINLAGLSADDNSEIHVCLLEAEKAAQRATGLTQQLLTFAKGGAPVRKVVALPQLLVETATFAARGSHAQCVFDLAEDLWPAEIDPGQISQVVNNLVLNSIQAMPAGGPIHISAGNAAVDDSFGLPVPAGRYIQLVFKDRGIGIAPEHIEKIFDPYFTTKEQGKGLGLAASHAIIRKHQGAILVESASGEGTRFIVYLPAAEDLPEDKTADAAFSPAGGGKILVMDDEQGLRTLMSRILDFYGYESVVTADGAEAVETYCRALFSGAGFDAVILDLTVAGGMGGREALEGIRAIDPEAVAIVSSGYSKDPVMADYRLYGFSGVISKPYTAKELGAELQRVLSIKRQVFLFHRFQSQTMVD